MREEKIKREGQNGMKAGREDRRKGQMKKWRTGEKGEEKVRQETGRKRKV